MLTAPNVARMGAPKSGKYSWHPDRVLPSFGIRVYTTGRKVWGITRRWNGAKYPSFRRLGEYPDMGLAEARTRAREMLANPSAIRPRQQATAESPPDTFASLAEAFLKHGRTKRGRVLRAATLREYRRALTIYAAELRNRPVRDIRRADVASLIRAVADKRGAMTAMRTRAALSRFFGWLLANDLAEFNPVTGTEGYSAPPRSRVLTDGELAGIWQATDDDADFSLILRLLLWTGARRTEVGSMRWSEIEGGTWTVPAERSKNHKALVLPLPRQALAALQAHPRIVGRDNVFGRTAIGFQGWSYPKKRIDARLGFSKPWDLHDIRRSVQTRLIAMGTNSEVVNRLLNHAMGPIDAAYNHHDYLAEKSAALAHWADELDRIVKASHSNLIAMPSAR
jgi:integrase